MSTGSSILLTAPGSAAIAVIRLRGLHVPAFLQGHFTKPAKVARCVHGDLHDGGRVIDDAVVVLVDQQTADLNIHGGSWVVHSVLELARRAGFEPTDSTNLPSLSAAVDGDSALQEEVLTHLSLPRTETGIRILMQQPFEWERLLAHSQSPGIDLSQELDRLEKDQTLIHLLFPPTVAIVGPANVGKSTLANQLFGQERSITADLPGTTRDWVGALANIDGLPIQLLDTPGLRHTDDLLERAAISISQDQIRRSQLVIVVLDATRPLAGEQAQVLAAHPGAMVVLNKIDANSADDFTSLHPLRTVATMGEGVDELRKSIVHHFCKTTPIPIDRAYIWTERQRAIVRSTHVATQRSLRPIDILSYGGPHP